MSVRPEWFGVGGWAGDEELVPVEQAYEFFTNRILAEPSDAFSLLMRGLIMADKKDFDRAIADYTSGDPP